MFSKSAREDYFGQLQSYSAPVSRIVEIGVELPERVVSNEEIAELVNASAKLKKSLPGMIKRTTGNRDRLYAPEGAVPSDLAVAATHDCLKRAGCTIDDVDTLIFSSTDMDMFEPATSNIVQAKLGKKVVNAFDVSNACNSFLQGMNMGNSLIATGAAKRVLVCSGEMGSAVANFELSDPKELRTKMGGLTIADAGAAILLEAADPDSDSGIKEINLMSLGEHWELCHVPENLDWRLEKGTTNPWFYLDMPGLAKVARHHTLKYFEDYKELRKDRVGEKQLLDAVDFFIPHQISRTMLEKIFVDTMKMDPEKVIITADTYGNTASTAIPLALRWLMDNGLLELGSGKTCYLYGAASGFGIGHMRVKF